jgi:hypothetical protein
MSLKSRLAALEKRSVAKRVLVVESWGEQADGTFRNRGDGRTLTAEEFNTMERRAGPNENLVFLTIRRIQGKYQKAT